MSNTLSDLSAVFHCPKSARAGLGRMRVSRANRERVFAHHWN